MCQYLQGKVAQSEQENQDDTFVPVGMVPIILDNTSVDICCYNVFTQL